MDLLIEDCCREKRPVYLYDTYEDLDQRCEWCERQSLYVFTEYDDQHFDPPLPDIPRLAHCGSPPCMTAQEWFYDKTQGSYRRRQFMQMFGERLWQSQKETRLDKALTMILAGEARKIA